MNLEEAKFVLGMIAGRGVLAAAGVASQPEPKYEYGNQATFHSHTRIIPALDRETAMKRAWLQPAFRRVKGGAWEPVPNHEGEQS